MHSIGRHDGLVPGTVYKYRTSCTVPTGHYVRYNKNLTAGDVGGGEGVYFKSLDFQRFQCFLLLTDSNKKQKDFDHEFLNFCFTACGLHFILAAFFMVISRQMNIVGDGWLS